MNEVGNTLKPLSQQGKDLAGTAAAKVQSGIHSTQQAAGKTIDKASDKVDER